MIVYAIFIISKMKCQTHTVVPHKSIIKSCVVIIFDNPGNPPVWRRSPSHLFSSAHAQFPARTAAVPVLPDRYECLVEYRLTCHRGSGIRRKITPLAARLQPMPGRRFHLCSNLLQGLPPRRPPSTVAKRRKFITLSVVGPTAFHHPLFGSIAGCTIDTLRGRDAGWCWRPRSFCLYVL